MIILFLRQEKSFYNQEALEKVLKSYRGVDPELLFSFIAPTHIINRLKKRFRKPGYLFFQLDSKTKGQIEEILEINGGMNILQSQREVIISTGGAYSLRLDSLRASYVCGVKNGVYWFKNSREFYNRALECFNQNETKINDVLVKFESMLKPVSREGRF